MPTAKRKPHYPINPSKWYLVDTKRLTRQGRPKVLKKSFDNVKQIKMCLSQYLGAELRFEYIKGSEAIELGLQIMRWFPGLRIYLRKYCYDNDMITPQDKKSYRTKFRRHHRTKKGIYYKRFG